MDIGVRERRDRALEPASMLHRVATTAGPGTEGPDGRLTPGDPRTVRCHETGGDHGDCDGPVGERS